MTIAVITPYYSESREVLERCIRSVRDQSVACMHIIVADGEPQEWLDTEPYIRHMRLDRPHSDYGNTPRGMAALMAASEGYDAIAFLDADCWYEPDHLAKMLAASEGHDYAVSVFTLRRLDGSVMILATEAPESHADTSCLLLRPGAYHALPIWTLMPKELTVIGDRVFYHALKSQGLRRAIVREPTVNYTCTWASVYRALGEEPPLPLKENPDHGGVQRWIAGLSETEATQVNRLIQSDVRTLYHTPGLTRLDAAAQRDLTVVASFYMSNIDQSVVEAQRAVVSRFLPKDCIFMQIETTLSHDAAIDKFLRETDFKIYVFLDIDCIPLSEEGLPYLVSSVVHTGVAGCTQRANHIDNGAHLYAGPFCVAFNRRTWKRAGSPSFKETVRGDVGEELTWKCKENDIPVLFIMPSKVDQPRWQLTRHKMFGLGTEYEGMFYHQFEIRNPANTAAFLKRCAEVMAS